MPDEGAVGMPRFVVARTFETYGVPSLAKRYLCEMVLGLRAHGDKSLRLQLFAESLGLDSSLDQHRHSLILSVMLSTIMIMDQERGLTRMRKDQFFARFGEYNELYLPFEYLLRGLQQAVDAELNHEFSERLIGAIVHRSQPYLLDSEKDCQADARATVHRRKGAVLGARVGGPFVNIDRFLNLVQNEHREATRRRANTVRTVIRKYDESGDGLLQLNEFRAMIAAISPNLQAGAIDKLWRTCGGAGSCGSIDAATLEICLFEHEWRSSELLRAQAEAGASAPSPQAADATRAREEARAREEMAAISKLWDEVKDGAERVKQLEHYLSDWQVVVRLQAWARGAVTRLKVRQGEL